MASTLGEIVQAVFDRMDHDPGKDAYRDAVVRRVNEHQRQVCDLESWWFLQQEDDFVLLADVEGSASVTATPDATNPRAVTGSGTSWTIADEGADLTITNETRRIVRVESATSLYVDEPFAAGLGGATSDWSISYATRLLPADCTELLAMVNRDDRTGKLIYISRDREEALLLDRTVTGDAAVVVDDDPRSVRGPDRAPTLAGTTGGDLNVSTKYAYCYTLIAGGVESRSSPVATVTLSATQTAVNISGLMNVTWMSSGGSSLESGITKRLYRRDVTNNGPWLRSTEVTAASTTSAVDNRINPYIAGTGSDYTDHPSLLRAGPRMTVRVWEPPAEDTAVRIRYLRAPLDMTGDTDEPSIPTAYAHVLTWLTLRDILSDVGNMASSERYGKRADTLIEQMTNRHLSRGQKSIQMGRWNEMSTRRYHNVGTITKT